MSQRTYLDWNATAPLRPQAREAMAAAMDVVGNPSSVHAEGRAARQILERAREQVAAAVGAEPHSVIFTSGGSEANALALSRAIEHVGRLCDVAIVSAIEHVSVLAGGDFPSVERFGAGRDGVASLAELETRLAATKGAKPLVALMAANNETGVIQPVREAAERTHAAGGVLHVDAVQALGKILLDVRTLGADLLSVSAHKIGGPMGVGALVLANDKIHLRGSRFGGGQERNRRGGTENLIGIAGLGAAVAEAVRDLEGEARRLTALRRRLEDGLKAMAPETVIFGEQAPAGRVANTLQFAVPGIRAQTALMALDLDGVAVSSGSACSSGTMKFSEVVRAMGYDLEIAEGAVRLSMGGATSEDEIDCFLNAWRKLSQPLLKKREIAA